MRVSQRHFRKLSVIDLADFLLEKIDHFVTLLRRIGCDGLLTCLLHFQILSKFLLQAAEDMSGEGRVFQRES